MVKSIKIIIPGKIPTTTFQSKGVNRRTGCVYTSKAAQDARAHFRSWVARALREHGKDFKLEPPYVVDIEYYYVAPENIEQKMLENDVSLWPKITKPDLDNLGKMILDVLTETGVIEDDSKVYIYRSSKFYRFPEDGEYVMINISRHGDDWS